jgi:hypothetical protein
MLTDTNVQEESKDENIGPTKSLPTETLRIRGMLCRICFIIEWRSWIHIENNKLGIFSLSPESSTLVNVRGIPCLAIPHGEFPDHLPL